MQALIRRYVLLCPRRDSVRARAQPLAVLGSALRRSFSSQGRLLLFAFVCSLLFLRARAHQDDTPLATSLDCETTITDGRAPSTHRCADSVEPICTHSSPQRITTRSTDIIYFHPLLVMIHIARIRCTSFLVIFIVNKRFFRHDLDCFLVHLSCWKSVQIVVMKKCSQCTIWFSLRRHTWGA